MTNSSLQPSKDNSQQEGDQVIGTHIFQGRNVARSDTPETWLPDIIMKPDITFKCKDCDEYLSFENKPYHDMYHKSLTMLDYSHSQTPPDVRSLSQRRKKILKRLQADTPTDSYIHPEDVRQIDMAYEVVKNYIEDAVVDSRLGDQPPDTGVTDVTSVTDVTGVNSVSFDCSLGCVKAVGICSSPNMRWKHSMEDFHVYQDYFGDDPNKCYVAVFDGYHGSVAAKRSGQELHGILLQEMAKFDSNINSTVARNAAEPGIDRARASYESFRPGTSESVRVSMHQDSSKIVEHVIDASYEAYTKIMFDSGIDMKADQNNHRRHHMTDEIHNVFKKSYLRMDVLLSHGLDEKSRVRWSGTSAVTVVIQNTKSKINEVTSLDQELSEPEPYPGETTECGKSSEVIGLIHIANAGNCRGLLVQDGLAQQLTKDHTGRSLKERRRVLAAEGRDWLQYFSERAVSSALCIDSGSFSNGDRCSLVCGVLPVTRGLGNHGDGRLKGCIIVEPHVRSFPISQQAQLLILASGGLWEVLSNKEVTSLLVQMLPDQQIPPAGEINESLLPLLQPLSHTDRHGGTNDSADTISQTTSQKFAAQAIKISAIQDIADTTQAGKNDRRKELARGMAERLTQAALLAGARDNVTVIVVLLPGCCV